MENLFYDICEKYNLGRLLEEPKSLKGGFMHKMYSLNTENGKYAIKLLNPHIMNRQGALQKFKNAENLEEILLENKIPVVVPIKFNNEKMQKIGNQYFYIFPWCKGIKLDKNKISQEYCKKIGDVLGKIHKIDFKYEDYKLDKIDIDWKFYLDELKVKNYKIYSALSDNIHIIDILQQNYNKSIDKIPKVRAICHNDMDIKNILWDSDNFYIIDLECLAYSNPFIELLELSLCWSGYEQCNVDFKLCIEFINSYIKSSKLYPNDWESLYECNIHRIYWLEYNIKRVLGIEYNKDEEKMAILEVESTLKILKYYYDIKDDFLNYIKNNIL